MRFLITIFAASIVVGRTTGALPEGQRTTSSVSTKIVRAFTSSTPSPTNSVALTCTTRTPAYIPPAPPAPAHCDLDCECIEGAQPRGGRVYCGWCNGVNPKGGKTMIASDIVLCQPGGTDRCCNYGHYDSRCEIHEGECPNFEVFCPGEGKLND